MYAYDDDGWYVCMYVHACVLVEMELNGLIILGGDDVGFAKESGEALGERDDGDVIESCSVGYA